MRCSSQVAAACGRNQSLFSVDLKHTLALASASPSTSIRSLFVRPSEPPTANNAGVCVWTTLLKLMAERLRLQIRAFQSTHHLCCALTDHRARIVVIRHASKRCLECLECLVGDRCARVWGRRCWTSALPAFVWHSESQRLPTLSQSAWKIMQLFPTGGDPAPTTRFSLSAPANPWVGNQNAYPAPFSSSVVRRSKCVK